MGPGQQIRSAPLPHVDLVVVTRGGGPLDPAVQTAIRGQQNVALHIYHVMGGKPLDGQTRWAPIAEARNRGKRLGTSPWLMFLDDDVELQLGCVRELVDALSSRPSYGALAADYLGEKHPSRVSYHVSMGATLFRRSALRAIRFRWGSGSCECQCCCHDLRSQGMAIDYLASAHARHLAPNLRDHGDRTDKGRTEVAPFHDKPEPRGLILTAFNSAHLQKFRTRFLRSLRRSGNAESIRAVGYGLGSYDVARLSEYADVAVMPVADNGIPVPIRRLWDFQKALADIPAETPVAYWDAGDVLFQGRLQTLWRLVATTPDKLLVVEEPTRHPANPSVRRWTLSITRPDARAAAFDLLSQNPVLNGGFAAGTAGSMIQYLQSACQLRLRVMDGSDDHADQTVMNLYCHGHPERYLAISDDWNYCLFGRERAELVVGHDGTIRRADQSRVIPVVHGNARTLEGYFLRAGTPRNRAGTAMPPKVNPIPRRPVAAG